MQFVVIGAGLMGRAAAWYLARGGNGVTVVDIDEKMLRETKELVPSVVVSRGSAADEKSLKPLLEKADAAISCVPYYFNLALSKLCIATKTHFVDLGGNNDVVDQQFNLGEEAKKAGVTIMPDCGLAPGMIGIWAMEGVNELDECERVTMYCGGLPQKPQPPLNYMRLFSINGLVNEYIEPCRIIAEGEVKIVPGMSGVEKLDFEVSPYNEMEAFYTSGGTSTLVETLLGRVDQLEYKTLRYDGHIQFFRTLHSMGFLDSETLDVGGKQISPRQFSQSLLQKNLTDQGADVTLLRVDCEGHVEQVPTMIRLQCIDKADEKNGLSSMMRCTAFPAAAIANMLADKTISMPGAQPQELVVAPNELRKLLADHGIIVEKMISTDYEIID